MANQEQLEMLKRSVEEWNAWRSATEERVDLIGVDLSSAYLRGADLSGALLIGSDLRSADLSHAQLNYAILIRAFLSKANLSSAVLANADLTGAHLIGPDLKNANLNNANLASAFVVGALVEDCDFSDAIVWHTHFADIGLSEARGLETIQCKGPCSIDHRTLEKSTPLPESFLRGVGFSDEFIAYIPTLFGGSAINLYSCFISYSSSDKEFAKHLYDKLQGRGVRCWLDEHQILPGEDIRTEIDVGVRVWDKVLLCCSKTSLIESNWVDDEIEKALQKEQKLRKDTGQKLGALIPLNLDNYLFSDDYQSGFKSEIIRRNAADFTNWKDHDALESALEKVLKALRLDGGKPPAPEAKLGKRR